MTRSDAIELLLDYPVEIGRAYGFDKLTDLHNTWIKSMVTGEGDDTLQAHRNSYKTTCVSIALADIAVAFPKEKTMFMRKTDEDTKEIISQAKKILLSDVMQIISLALWGTSIKLTKDSSNEINTNLAAADPRAMSQVLGIGIGGSLTGKHFDRIFTDDIINVKDRLSRAERERTKLAYMELQNIKNRGGRIFNTGTPWHKDDCFTIMPKPAVYDCYSTGIMSDADIEEKKSTMTSSLFAANYEMKHIADEDVLFTSPNKNADPALCEQGLAHIDASYGGEDFTAFTIVHRKDGKYYVFGKLYHKHVDDIQSELIAYRKQFNAGKIYCENNADKGYLAKALREKGERVSLYHEDMNKYFKITSYLKAVWKDVYFVNGTDEDYIDQVCDYNENAAHDDAPDSLASLIRAYSRISEEEYKPLFIV